MNYGSIQVLSSFAAALRDARYATGRDENTGKPLPGGRHESWIGLVGYLTVLEHIGNTMEAKRSRNLPQGLTRSNLTGLERALWDFGSPEVPWNEIQAIYALRSSFAHHYGVIYIHHTNPLRTHCFELTNNERVPMISLPPIAWDGNLVNPVPHDRKTIMNVVKLGSMIEVTCEYLQEKALKGEVGISTMIPGGIREFQVRYGIMVSPSFTWDQRMIANSTSGVTSIQ
jgi:hypothetical protein